MVLGLYASVKQKKGKKTDAREKDRVFVGFKPKEATSILWTRDKKKVTLKKIKGRWEIVSPLMFPADKEAVETLLADLETLIFTRRIKGNLKRSEYKLQEPRITIEIEGALPAGKRAVLDVGGLDITERNIYVARAGQPEVLVVGKHFLDSADKGLMQLRSKKALMFDAEKVATIALIPKSSDQGEALRIKHEKKQDLYYLTDVDGKILARAHKESIEDLKRKLDDLKITRYQEGTDAGKGKKGDEKETGARLEAKDTRDATGAREGEMTALLDLSTASVKIVVNDGAAHEVVVGGECSLDGKKHKGEVLVKREQKPAATFCVNERELRKILRPVKEFRDLKLGSIPLDQLEKLVVAAGSKKLVLEKTKKGDWKISSGTAASKDKDQKADSAQVGRFLDDLQAFTVLGYSFPKGGQLGPYGLEQPEATLSMTSADGRTEVLELGALSGEYRHLRRKGEAAVLLLHKEIAERFLPDPLFFRDRQVMSFDQIDLKKIVLKSASITEELTKKEGTWTLTKPFVLKADSDQVDTIIRTASALKATKFVGRKVLPEHGFGGAEARTLRFYVEPDKDLDAKIPGKEKPKKKTPVWHVLLLGKDLVVGKGCYGRLGDKNEVFVLSKQICTDLRSPMADRSVMEITPAEATQMSYDGPKGKEELTKRGPEWYRKAGPKVEQGSVQDLLTTLQNLKASEVVAYGKPLPEHGRGKPFIAISVTLQKDKRQTLYLGAEKPGKDGAAGRYAWVAGRDVIYLLAKYSVDDLIKVKF